MSDCDDEVGQFIRRYVQTARRYTLAPPAEPPALGDAHRLLSDSELERAVKFAGAAWGETLSDQWPWPRNDHGRLMVPDRNDIALHAREFVWYALCNGRFRARAIDPEDPVRSKPFTIPAERWGFLYPDWERSTATCEGKLVAIGITVEVAERQPQAAETRPPGRVSPAELDRWFLQHKAEWDANQIIPPVRETEKAAKAKFGDRIGREQAREARRKLAPEWPRKPGRRSPRNCAG